MTEDVDRTAALLEQAQKQTHALEQIRGAVWVLLVLGVLAGLIWVFVLLS